MGLATVQPLTIDISGAAYGSTALTNPLLPAFQGIYQPGPGAEDTVSNITNSHEIPGASSLFAFTADTPTALIHAGNGTPARIYAASGDIVGFGFGQTWRFVAGGNTVATWYIAAEPALIEAGRDIIAAGGAELAPVAASGASGLRITSNLILNTSADDSSVVSAGRDIFYANFDIAGAGTLLVSAGRNLYQANEGSLYSLGQIVGASGSPTGGAGILVMAGLAQNPPDWTGFESLYLGSDTAGAGGSVTFTSPSVAGAGQTTLTYTPPAGATAALAIDAGGSSAAPDTISGTTLRPCQAGAGFCDYHAIAGATPLSTVARSYDGDLVTWMQANAGFVAPTLPAGLNAGVAQAATRASALAAFNALPLTQRIPFLMQIYFSELAASGEEQTGALLATDPLYTATSTARLGSLARGREAHAALEPDPAVAAAATTSNSITLYGGSGISTGFGGSIGAFAPGGQLVLGLASQTPPTPAAGQPAAGLITYGSGDVNVATYGSVLLGQSRIFTTFGGAIDIWSEGADINAGNGSKTTQVYQPPRIDYDEYGNLTLSPTAPTSGAGIATLAPVAGVPPGDVVLVVEHGVIDTGEAGIRSSGRTSLTGTVVGTGGVTAAAGAFGLPSVAVPNVGALAAASSASAAAAAAAAPVNAGGRGAGAIPSIITVEVVSFGGDTFQ